MGRKQPGSTSQLNYQHNTVMIQNLFIQKQLIFTESHHFFRPTSVKVTEMNLIDLVLKLFGAILPYNQPPPKKKHHTAFRRQVRTSPELKPRFITLDFSSSNRAECVWFKAFMETPQNRIGSSKSSYTSLVRCFEKVSKSQNGWCFNQLFWGMFLVFHSSSFIYKTGGSPDFWNINSRNMKEHEGTICSYTFP